MKTSKWLLAATLPLALLFSCQKQIAEVSDETAGSFSRAVSPKAAYTATSCATQCITSSSEYYEKSATQSYSTAPSGSVTVTVWNTPTEIVYSFTSTVAMKKITIAGVVEYDNTTGSTSFVKSYTLPMGWTGCQTISKTVEVRRENSSGVGGGVYLNFGAVTYNLIPVCTPPPSCQLVGNSFSGTAGANSCGSTRSATFTLSSELGVSYFKMQGGLTNFTGENATVFVNGMLVNFNGLSSDDWATGTVGSFTVGQRTPGGSSNRNIRVVGPAGTCGSVTVQIFWSSTNGTSIITGDWSVKDANGVALAQDVAGLTCNQ